MIARDKASFAGTVSVWGLQLLLALLLANLAASLIWAGAAPRRDAALARAAAGGVGPGAGGLIVDQQTLVTFDVFGRLEEAEPAVVQPVTQQVTRLNLELTGTRPSSNRALSSAFIRLPNDRQETFAEGQEIIRDVTLDSVYSSYVILNNRGVLERLDLEILGSVLPDLPQWRQGGEDLQAFDGVLETQGEGQTPTPSPTVAVDATDGEVSQDDSEDEPQSNMTLVGAPSEPIRLDNARELLQIVQFAPQQVDGQTRVVVSPVASAESFEALGLRTGDVVLTVNGESLSDEADLFGLFERLQKTSRFSVDVERDGEPVSIDYWVLPQ